LDETLIYAWIMRKLRRKTLVCMRLNDMIVVHPDQIERQCHRCGEVVGIYPSGQMVLAASSRIDITCQVCAAPSSGTLAPGAAAEPFQSMRR